MPTQLIHALSLFMIYAAGGFGQTKMDKAISSLIGHILKDIVLNSEPLFSEWVSMPFFPPNNPVNNSKGSVIFMKAFIVNMITLDNY